MAEKLAELRQKGGGGVPSNLFYVSYYMNATTSWETSTLDGSVNDPDSATVGIAIDPAYAHTDNGGLVIDKAVPKAYITGSCFGARNSSGTMIYGGIRVLKNGTVITGASVTGSSSQSSPSFRRIQTSLAVGDVITIQRKASATIGGYPIGYVNIVTDD